MAKRMMIAVTVPDDTEVDGLVCEIPSRLGLDPTVWEWSDFWLDVADGVVDATADRTVTEESFPSS